jgi:hypothetical protein
MRVGEDEIVARELSMDVAFLGLLGVIIGGLITAGATYFFERRRDQIAERKENRTYLIELKKASRLIDADLLQAQAAAALCIEKRNFWQEEKLPNEAWPKYSSIIAPILSYADWVKLIQAVIAIDHLNGSLSIKDNNISDTAAKGIEPMLRDIRAGRLAIAPLCLDAQDVKEQKAAYLD